MQDLAPHARARASCAAVAPSSWTRLNACVGAQMLMCTPKRIREACDGMSEKRSSTARRAAVLRPP
eukprot:3376887-Pleurochrysis_carterae.AAC.2